MILWRSSLLDSTPHRFTSSTSSKKASVASGHRPAARRGLLQWGAAKAGTLSDPALNGDRIALALRIARRQPRCDHRSAGQPYRRGLCRRDRPAAIDPASPALPKPGCHMRASRGVRAWS